MATGDWTYFGGSSLPLTHRCSKCGEWYHNAHACMIPIVKEAIYIPPSAPTLTEADVRRIVREELLKVKIVKKQK